MHLREYYYRRHHEIKRISFRYGTIVAVFEPVKPYHIITFEKFDINSTAVNEIAQIHSAKKG